MITADSHREPLLETRRGARRSAVEASIRSACARIAPTWPLDRFIAVNPLWGLTDLPISEAAARLGAASGARMLMPRTWYRQAYREGRFGDEHLREAIASSDARVSLGELKALLEEEEPPVPRRARLLDVLDAERDLAREASWQSVVTNGVSQFCAAYFDDEPARTGPRRGDGLFSSWRRHAAEDRSIALRMGVPREWTSPFGLPDGATETIAAGLEGLGVQPSQYDDYLWGLLLDQNGWASWCAYRRWTARLAGTDDDAISDLLAIRVAWEWMLFRAGGDAIARRWRTAKASWAQVDATAASVRSSDWLLQTAVELAWRTPLVRAFPAGLGVARPVVAPVQAVFCIDVRSEVFRRSLEGISPVQTLGFAGFFGVPMEYRPVGAASPRPQLPGLLAPRLRAEDTGLDASAVSRSERHLDLADAWTSFRTDPLSGFAFVEALGLSYAGKLLADGLGLGARARRADGLTPEQRATRKPRLVATSSGEAVTLDERCDLAAGMLRGMSLTRDFARLVLLVGHGSATRNNPHAAGLDCGACCGQTGEANARVAAALLNDAAVRAGLSTRGLSVPETTWFVPALHETTTDTITLYDLDEVPAEHRAELGTLQDWLVEACAATRAERAGRLGLASSDREELRRELEARASDWSQVRPEWGLAANAAFVVAPREHVRHLNLGGRAFLHEYRQEEDEGFRVLESIMTAPMLVTHWINFQYYASTVDNERYGSGNKVLHDVVGGHVGVFEGNGGDLRIGLPLQSVHDGTRFVHEPLRLAVFLEAPREAIDGVLARHDKVRDLVENGWLSLFQLDVERRAVHERTRGRWERRDVGEEGEVS